MKRFGRFSNMIPVSKTNALRNLYNNVSQDCQSTTGYNLRRIMLHNDITPNEGKHKDQPYYAVPPSERWKLRKRISEHKFWTSPPLEQLLERRNILSKEEISCLMQYSCCSIYLFICKPMSLKYI